MMTPNQGIFTLASGQRLFRTMAVGAAFGLAGLMTSIPAQAEDTADSRTTSRTYNDYGQVTSVDGPRTDVIDVTTYEYDERGNRLAVINALGHETRYSNYERNGLPGTITDPNGLVTHLTYDWQGKITEQRVEAPEGNLVTRYVYDPVGQLIEIHPPTGTSLYYEYDAAQRLIGIRTESGARLDYELDDLGNVVSVETHDQLGTLVRRHQQAYDGLSRLQERIGGTDGQTTAYDYDADGNRIGQTDAKQQSSSRQFDALNRLTEVTDRANGITGFEYNDRDRIVAVTDPKGLTTRYDYNGHGEIIAVHSPDTGTTTYAYDKAGNRTRATDANGQVIETDYDALNRRTAIRYPATPERNVTYTYDDTSQNNSGTANAGLGRLTAVQFAGGERRFRYDTLGRLVAETQLIGVQSYTQRYVYDQGQLSARQLPSGAWLGYAYRDDGRLSGLYLQDAAEVTDPYQRQPIVTDLDYLPFGPVTHLTYGNGIEQTNRYDLDYRLTEQQSPVWDSGYYYDPNSNLNQLIDYLADSASGDGSQGDASGLFQYDALDRLITAEQAQATRDYQYDPVGNRLNKTTTTETDTDNTGYGYSAQSHRLQNEADWQYTYDDAGNLLSNGRFDFAYNEQGQLARVFEAGSDTLVAEYHYNASRQRISKTVPYSGPDHAALAEEAEQRATEHQQQAEALQAQAQAAQQQADQRQQQANQASTDAQAKQAESDQHQNTANDLTAQADEAQADADQWAENAQAQRDRIVEPADGFGQWLTNLIARGLSSLYDWIASQYQDSADALTAQAEQAQANADSAQAATDELIDQAEFLHQQANQAQAAADDYTAQAEEQRALADQALAEAEEHRALAANPENTTATTHFVYRPNGQLQGEYSDTGILIREYVYLGNRPIAIITPTAANDANFDRYYIHSDHLSTPKVITDQAQATVWKATHTPFGQATILKDDIDNSIRFPGQYADIETGLHYNWHRYYDPSTGRYVTSDPIGLAGGLSTYGYANQNPVRYTDPFGLFSVTGPNPCQGLSFAATTQCRQENAEVYRRIAELKRLGEKLREAIAAEPDCECKDKLQELYDNWNLRVAMSDNSIGSAITNVTVDNPSYNGGMTVSGEPIGGNTSFYNQAFEHEQTGHVFMHEFAHMTPDIHSIKPLPINDPNEQAASFTGWKLYQALMSGQSLCSALAQ